MADILLVRDKDDSETHIANTFIDNYMASADGEFVKLYLYLQRCLNGTKASFSISDAAGRFDHTENFIKRALKYWEKMRLLHLDYDKEKNLSGIRLLDPEELGDTVVKDSSDSLYGTKVTDSEATAVTTPKKKKRTFTADELLAFQDRENVRELLFVTETYLGRPLSSTDLNTILYWLDELYFSTDLCTYLVEYCVGNNHKSIRYMDKVALDWKEREISTVEQAKDSSIAFNGLYSRLSKEMGIRNRSLTTTEKEKIEKWKKDYGFSEDLILEACRRTIAATGQSSFPYAERILESWKKQKASTMADVAKLDLERQEAKVAPAHKTVARKPSSNRFNNFPQRAYDYEKLEQELEQELIHRYANEVH